MSDDGVTWTKAEPPGSYDGYRRGQQVYPVIEFCNGAEALWAKLESGHWEWLGVKSVGGRHTFVLGRPPRPSVRGGRGSWRLSEDGATGEHRVIVEVPHPRESARLASREDCTSEQGARAKFNAKIEKLSTPTGSSGIYRVSLFVGDRRVATELVVRTLPNHYPPARPERSGP